MNNKNNDLEKRKSRLSITKQALLEQQIHRYKSGRYQSNRIPRRSKTNRPPLSFAQTRLWFLDQFEPGNPAYNILSAYHLRGPLNPAALEQSFNEIIRCHEILITTFKLIDDQPAQYILDSLKIHLLQINLQHITGEDRDAEVQCLAKEEAKRPFNLYEGPLIRTILLKLDQEEHVLLITMHHIITDGWSYSIFLKGVSDLYNGFLQGQPAQLPELPIQYADFAVWQRSWLQGDVLEKQLGYWRSKLDGVPVLEIPTDHPRPTLFTYDGAYKEFECSQDLTIALKQISQKGKATLFMTLLAVCQILLQRYTGQDDIVVGTSIANRNHTEIENLIGFFVNTLVIRSDLSGNPTFWALLEQVRETTIEAYSYQDLPFEKLVEELQPVRDLSRNPFFQTSFLLQNLPPSNLELAKIKLERLNIGSDTSKFDLSFVVHEIENTLRVRISYNSNLFKPSTIDRISKHYHNLLDSVVKDPDQRIGMLPYLDKDEQCQMIVDWNATKEPYPVDLCIHQLFEAWVERTPDETCLVFEEKQITYAELNQKANSLAHKLIKFGIGPEKIVGVCMDRSIDMIIAIMSILKAGGGYLALDPVFPEERQAFLLTDSNSKVLITQEKFKDRFPELTIPLIDYNALKDPLATNQPNPTTRTIPDNMAYVMYTSGSTGKPKGVMISHTNVLGFLFGYKKVTLDGPKRIGTSVAQFNFDVSVEEIFATICFGGTLHIIHPDNSSNADYFAQYLLDHQITTTYILPAFLVEIAKFLTKSTGNLNLKCLITGLAPKKESVLQSFRSLSPELRILNAYGPTEVTYGATAYEFVDIVDPDRDVPIGVPFPNYQVYIVDKNLQPVPIGVTGELLVGGVGISRGYLNRPGLTADKFIPDPFSGLAGSRLYRTGDLVRYLPDGNIEFLGRADQQVKVRGYRIELGEIESTLINLPGVQKGVVSTHEIETGDIRLVAYVQKSVGVESTVNELRNYLTDQLPGYMIPNIFMFLDEIPVLPNGKVNRKALPVPDLIRPDLDVAYQAPQNITEELLAGILANVLGVEQVGVNDNFFELGGHSLLATMAVSQIPENVQT